ncbi:MAG TPA: hypothetical protein VNZ22_02965, partial [Bacillota bacterium]|nr:hypothetical protein [Bacillota bacterium]
TVSELGFAADLPSGAWVQSAAGIQRIEPLRAPLFLRLQQAGPSQVFQLYQLLSQRSLIRPQSLPAFRLDVGCKDPATAGDLLKAIEQALASHGILLRPEGEKFVFAGREGDFDRVTPQLREVAATLRKTRSQANPGAENQVLPAGMINFAGADLNQVLMIYQELVGRTLLRPPNLPATTIAFHSYTPLTFEEAIYALNATLAMNGISILPVEEKFLFAFPTAQRQQVDSLLARSMPVHSPSGKEPLPAGSLNFSNAGLRQVMAVYQELCGKPVEVPASLPEVPFTLKSQTLLTAQEALHALDLLLGWNGFTVIPQDDGKGLQVVRLKPTR